MTTLFFKGFFFLICVDLAFTYGKWFKGQLEMFWKKKQDDSFYVSYVLVSVTSAGLKIR